MTTLPTLKDLVKDNTVRFLYYKEKELWYSAVASPSNFIFPVPIEDTGNAQFNNVDKAIFFMRWIKKHLEYLRNASNGG